MIPTFTKSYVAAVAVLGRRIVTFAAPTTASSVSAADASTDFAVGISDSLGADASQMLDIHRAGLAEVELGGTVAAGDPLTAAADGRAIKAVAASGTTVQIAAYAEAPGVIGDYIECFVVSNTLHEA